MPLALPLADLSQYFFGPIIFLLSFFMIPLILVQHGKGGGLTGALGGAGGQSAFGTKAGDVLTRITIVVAVIWIVLLGFTVWFYNEPSISSAVGDSAIDSSAALNSGLNASGFVEDAGALVPGPGAAIPDAPAVESGVANPSSTEPSAGSEPAVGEVSGSDLPSSQPAAPTPENPTPETTMTEAVTGTEANATPAVDAPNTPPTLDLPDSPTAEPAPAANP